MLLPTLIAKILKIIIVHSIELNRLTQNAKVQEATFDCEEDPELDYQPSNGHLWRALVLLVFDPNFLSIKISLRYAYFHKHVIFIEK